MNECDVMIAEVPVALEFAQRAVNDNAIPVEETDRRFNAVGDLCLMIADWYTDHGDGDGENYWRYAAERHRTRQWLHHTEASWRKYLSDLREQEREHEEWLKVEKEKRRRQRKRSLALKPVRVAANCIGKSYKIVIVNGDEAPNLKGRSPHYETPGGRTILHPASYNHAAGRNVAVYVPSTMHIRVGRKWLEQHNIKVEE